MSNRIIIIGAGPAGLGAAYALHEAGYDNWCLYEAKTRIGGTSGSFQDEYGCWWDYAGHAFFGSDPVWNRVMDEVLGEERIWHNRQTYINFKGTLVPQPFEEHIECLPDEDMVECFAGLARRYWDKTKYALVPTPEDPFGAWLSLHFGEAICERFHSPYNRKIWQTDPWAMSADWLEERVCKTDFKRALLNASARGWKKEPERGGAWGPNAKFFYPLHGGTGEPYRRIAEKFTDRILTGIKVTKFMFEKQEVCIVDQVSGATVCEPYDTVISTMPLPGNFHTDGHLKSADVLALGVVYEAPEPHPWHWIYFPGDEPFHRIVNHSLYSPNNTPQPNWQAVMCEMSHTEPYPPLAGIEERFLDTLDSLGYVKRDSVHHVQVISVAPAYPVPTIGYREIVKKACDEAAEYGIINVGRFARWDYARGNMDHCFGDGYAVAQQNTIHDAI